MGIVWNRYGEAIGTTSGKSYTDNSAAASNTYGGGAQASKPWTGGGNTSTGSSNSSGSSNSGSSGGSSSSSSQNNAQWRQANFGYVPSWVSGGSTTPSTPAPTSPSKPPATPSTPPASSGGSSGTSSASTPTWQQQLDSYKTNTAAGLNEIARAGQVYNQKMASGDTAGAQAAHTWANQIRDAMGISSMYDSSTGAYKGSGADPVAAYRSSKKRRGQPLIFNRFRSSILSTLNL